MRKIILALTLLVFALDTMGLELNPATIKSMDVNITTEAAGSFSGTVSRGDQMEIFFISMQEDEENQEIISSEEYLEIAGRKILPSEVDRGGLRYAHYIISDLYEYAENNEFRVVRSARIKTNARIGIGADFNLQTGIKEFPEYTLPSDYIESDDPELISKAEVEFTSDSWIDTIRQVAEWVKNNVTYDFDKYYGAVYSAKQTYKDRAGVCDEFANLTAAFLRARGIPAKYVSGISFDGHRFGSHGWLEAYLPGTGWLGVDSTYGEAGFLDGAHFTTAKTADANRAVDFIITTTTRKPVEVQTKLELPRVEINSYETFTGLLDGKIVMQDELQPGETFQVRAEIKNVSGQDAIFPVEMVLHEDFKKPVQPSKLVHIRNGETKTVEWDSRAPERELNNEYYTYGIILLLPDGNITDKIKVVPKKKDLPQETLITVKDVSPYFDGAALEVATTLRNDGGKDGKITLELFFEGRLLDEQQLFIKGFETVAVTQRINNVKPGKATIRLGGAIEKTVEITVPEKQGGKITVEQKKPEDSEKQGTQTRKAEQEQTIRQPEDFLIFAAGLAAIFIAGTIGIIAFALNRKNA